MNALRGWDLIVLSQTKTSQRWGGIMICSPLPFTKQLFIDTIKFMMQLKRVFRCKGSTVQIRKMAELPTLSQY